MATKRVCSAYGDYNFPGDDPFHIRRIHVDDMLRLKNWGTIDPRRLRPAAFRTITNCPAQESESCSTSSAASPPKSVTLDVRRA